MSPRWIRTRPERSDTLRALVVAGGMAAVAGMAAFYFTRLFLAREELPAAPPPTRLPAGERREG